MGASQTVADVYMSHSICHLFWWANCNHNVLSAYQTQQNQISSLFGNSFASAVSQGFSLICGLSSTSLAADIGTFCLVDVPSLCVLPCLHLVIQILAVASSIPREDSCSKRCCLFGDWYLYLWASVNMSWDSAFPTIVASWLPTGGKYSQFSTFIFYGFIHSDLFITW